MAISNQELLVGQNENMLGISLHRNKIDYIRMIKSSKGINISHHGSIRYNNSNDALRNFYFVYSKFFTFFN